jgi:hypothetical protein
MVPPVMATPGTPAAAMPAPALPPGVAPSATFATMINGMSYQVLMFGSSDPQLIAQVKALLPTLNIAAPNGATAPQVQ